MRGRTVLAASFSEGRILICDVDPYRIAHDVRLMSNCDHRYSLSPFGTYLATVHALERESWVGLYVVGEECRLRHHLQVHEQPFDTFAYDNGSVLVELYSDVVFIDGGTKEASLLGRRVTLSCGCPVAFEGGCAALVPATHGSAVWLVTELGDAHLIEQDSPKGDRVYSIRPSPSDGRLFLRIGSKTVSSQRFDPQTCALKTVWSVKGGACWGGYSGDGHWISVQAEAGAASTILDSAGQLVGSMAPLSGTRWPLRGSLILDSRGAVADLQAGTIVENLGKAAFWRRLGL